MEFSCVSLFFSPCVSQDFHTEKNNLDHQNINFFTFPSGLP